MNSFVLYVEMIGLVKKTIQMIIMILMFIHTLGNFTNEIIISKLLILQKKHLVNIFYVMNVKIRSLKIQTYTTLNYLKMNQIFIVIFINCMLIILALIHGYVQLKIRLKKQYGINLIVSLKKMKDCLYQIVNQTIL